MNNLYPLPQGPVPSLGRSVSIEHAAQLLKVSRRTIYNRIRDGRLRTMRTIGGSQRVLVESLLECGFRPVPVQTALAPGRSTAMAPGRPTPFAPPFSQPSVLASFGGRG